jgi:hypothetical protein
MDKIKVDVPREEPPAWARTIDPPGTPGTGMSGPKITPRQRDYLLALIEKKQVKPDQEGKIDIIMKCLRISESPEEYGMSRSKASELIDWFLKQSDKPIKIHEDEKQPGSWQSVPAGRYAVDGEDGLLKFYQVWRPKDNEYVFRVYVLHGPDESQVHRNAVPAIMTKIAADVRAAAIRYGMEIGSCSNCGRRLTNHISRELGIGPVCGGRMFGDEFGAMVSEKRTELWDRGINPDEELND